MSLRRRAFAVATLAALAVALAAQAGRLGNASAAECVWQKHTKRTVKHVKRHGKVHKVVRRRHWWSCDPPGGSGTAGGGGGSQAGSGGSSSPPTNSTLGVKAEDTPDYRYTLSKQTLPYGKVTVYFNNRGQDQHDFNIEPVGGSAIGSIPLTDPSTQKAASFNLGPGTYKLWCDVEGHDALGMHATLTLTP